MAAVLLGGHGGPDRLEYRTDVPAPRPARVEVLVRLAAAGVNNTDVNTRIGWYSTSCPPAASARETHAMRSDLGDEEPAAVPCAYSTADNMLPDGRVR